MGVSDPTIPGVLHQNWVGVVYSGFWLNFIIQYLFFSCNPPPISRILSPGAEYTPGDHLAGPHYLFIIYHVIGQILFSSTSHFIHFCHSSHIYNFKLSTCTTKYLSQLNQNSMNPQCLFNVFSSENYLCTVVGTSTSFKMFFTEPLFIPPQIMVITTILNFRIFCIIVVVQAVFP